MCRVIAVANQKGGVAKTAVAANLGIGLAGKGNRVLLIDADSQGSLTASLGYTEPDEISYTLTDVIEKVINEDQIDLDEGILHHGEGVDILPGNIELAGLEASIAGEVGSETFLREYISMVRSRYAYILLDTMPSLGMLTLNALTAADGVIIPVQAEFLSVKGLEQLLKTIQKVRRFLNPQLDIDGLLPTMVKRTNYNKEIIGLLKESYGGRLRIFESSIPSSVRAAEVSALGISIFAHDPKGKVAAAYRSLTEEVSSIG